MRVKLVVTRQDPDVLSDLEIFGANRAAGVAVRDGRGVTSRPRRLPTWPPGARSSSRAHRRVGLPVVHGPLCGSIMAIRRGRIEFELRVRLRRLLVPELDNGDCVKHGASQPLGSALARSTAKGTPRPVSLGVSVRPDGARGNDDEKQQRDEARDTI